ncbi:MAG: hypothetical protein KGZ57_11485 [Dethiobacter sp.]|nr:hypothetical protein [Dethiobacter sp.]MCL5981688.1 hypothetical protein [Bacillota bacterium]
MEIAINKLILAAVTTSRETVSGVPVFYAQDHEEQEWIAKTLSRVLEAIAHDLGNGTYILVRH